MVSFKRKKKFNNQRRLKFDTPLPKKRSTSSKDKQQHKESSLELESLWCFEKMAPHTTRTPS